MNSLILYQQPGSPIGLSPDAIRLKDEALAPLALISVVKNKDTNDRVVAAVQTIHDLLCEIDKAFDEAKEPALRECQRLDKLRREIKAELLEEEARGNTMCGDFQQHEQAKLKDAILAQKKTLTELEQKRFDARSKAETDEERDLIDMNFAQLAAAVPTPTPVVAEGQKVAEGWDIEVTSYAALIAAYPACAYCKPVLPEIRRLLDMGIIVPGVKASRKMISKVRKSKERKPIEV